MTFLKSNLTIHLNLPHVNPNVWFVYRPPASIRRIIYCLKNKNTIPFLQGF